MPSALCVAPFPARRLRRRRPRPSRLPARTSPRIVCLLFDSAGRLGWVGVQPAAEPRHLQRHNHERHVRRALLPAVEPLPLHAPSAVAAPMPSHLQAHTSPPHRTPSFGLGTQGASVFNQSVGFDTSSVTDMNYMFRVRSARALDPYFSQALPVACMPLTLSPRSTPSPASRPPHLAPHCMPSAQLGSMRRRSTSR